LYVAAFTEELPRDINPPLTLIGLSSQFVFVLAPPLCDSDNASLTKALPIFFCLQSLPCL
jgi:hypothetical protein